MSRILVIGDLLVDQYVFYKKERTDPANDKVPVISVINSVGYPGGAGNLVRTIKGLGKEDVEFSYLEQKPPLKIRNYIDGIYTFRQDINDKYEHDDVFIKKVINSIQPNDFVIISDYHKGTFNYKDIEKIIKRCNELGNVKTFIDTNFVEPEHSNATWLKINLHTARKTLSEIKSDAAKKLSEKYNCNAIITRGEEGFIAHSKDEDLTFFYTKNKNKTYIDAIGAGDSFLAGFVKSLFDEKSLLDSLIMADVVAHLSTKILGTTDVVLKEKSDNLFDNIKKEFFDNEEQSKRIKYIHCTFDNVQG